MPFIQWHALLTLAFLVVLSKLLLVLVHTRRLRKLMPPGPAGLPLFGNIFQVPTKEAWKKFGQWQCEYGTYPAPSSGLILAHRYFLYRPDVFLEYGRTTCHRPQQPGIHYRFIRYEVQNQHFTSP